MILGDKLRYKIISALISLFIIKSNQDRILPEVNVPKVETGDLIAFLHIDAYQEVSSANFNGLPRPATILVNGDNAKIIKLAETIEDVFHRNIIPERLKRSKVV